MVPSVANPSSSIDFRLLGPLTVTVDGEPVPIGGPRQMAVLARLMLTPEQVVTMGQLVESVWDGDEPAQPHVAVRSYISNLRRAIEPNRRRRSTDSCLASSPPGYRLAVDPESIDWVRFERLIGDGRRQLAAGDPIAAAATFREADRLWSGVPFPELPESPFFLAHKARLSELHDSAMELLFEALLARGDHASVAAEVEPAIAQSPLRERLTELGMLALYRSGRQSEALALGQRLRSRLLDRLGVDPSPAIEAIELKILNHDRSLEPISLEPTSLEPTIDAGRSGSYPANGANPPLTGSDRRVGPSLVEVEVEVEVEAEVQVEVEVDVDVEPDRRGRKNPLGRDAELRMLSTLSTTLAAGRSVTAVITGEQGIGKTTLARSVADALADEQVTVAWARTSSRQSAPLWPWAQAVLALLASSGDTPPVAITADLAPLTALGPSVTGALGLTAGETAAPFPSEAEIMLAVTRLLERLSSTAPVVVIFEDLQWADPQSISLLDYAASTLGDRPVGFVLTWRETDLTTTPTTSGLRELSRLANLIRLELEGLDAATIQALALGMGRRLTVEESEEICRRSGGNPLFIRELLANVDRRVGDGRHWSILADAVLDRVEHVHPMAASVLAPASLFRTPFTIDGLDPICEPPRDTVQHVLDAAVRHRVLIEEEPTTGSYRFGQPVIAEVLQSRLLATDRAGKHTSIGHHLLRASGPSCEVAHHLSQSKSIEDRLLAARSALTLFQREGYCSELRELDHYVTIGAAAVEQLEQARGAADPSGFDIDALGYRSWRSWVDGDPSTWIDTSRHWLRAALQRCPSSAGERTVPQEKQREKHGRAAASSEPAIDGDPLDGDAFDRLEAAIMNMIGSPRQPVGPTETGGFVDPSAEDIELLTESVERLGADSPARWACRLHLARENAVAEPGPSDHAKSLEEALKMASTARRRLRPDEGATVLKVLMARYCDDMDPAAKLTMLADIARLQPGLPTELFVLRYAYPALLELGRSFDADRRTEALLQTATGNENPLLAAEGRLLWIRHLLWTGQLDAAADEIDQALADWAALGLADAVPLIRQRRTLRLLRRRPIGEGHGPDNHHHLMIDRAGPAEVAFRLARMGDERRANECIEGVIDGANLRRLCLSDQALVAGAAALLGHEKAALTVYDTLVGYGDRPVVRPDGSIVLGPASLYAGLAAAASGNEEQAAQHFAAGKRAVQRFGGSPDAAELFMDEFGAAARSNPLPTNS